jgi:hypothetical protein
MSTILREVRCLFLRHNWEGRCQCIYCGTTRPLAEDWSGRQLESGLHEWDGCKCVRCGAIKDGDSYHRWDGCKCRVCGAKRDKEHRFQNWKCRVCGKEQNVLGAAAPEAEIVEFLEMLPDHEWSGIYLEEQSIHKNNVYNSSEKRRIGSNVSASEAGAILKRMINEHDRNNINLFISEADDEFIRHGRSSREIGAPDRRKILSVEWLMKEDLENNKLPLTTRFPYHVRIICLRKARRAFDVIIYEYQSYSDD